jgi:putative endopeptidase
VAARLLGRHVRRGAEQHVRTGEVRGDRRRLRAQRRRRRPGGRVFERLGEAEVEDLDVAVRRELHVRGLEVAVDDAALVGVLERLRDLQRDRQRFGDRDRSVREPLREILALDQLHREEAHAVGGVETVDRSDVRMVQRREQTGLALEAGEALGVRGEQVGQDLDRDVAAQRGVGGAPHHAHPAFAERSDDAVVGECGAGSEGHVAAQPKGGFERGPTPGPGFSALVARLACGARPPITSLARNAPLPLPRTLMSRRPDSRRAARTVAAVLPTPARRRALVLLVAAVAALAALTAIAIAARADQPRSSGLDKSHMDTSCPPCKDFYRYANGKWFDSAEIPPAYTGIGSGREMYDKNQETLYRVLEGAKRGDSKDPVINQVGAFYASLMDSARADREGWTPIKGDLQEIDAIATKQDLRKQFAKLEKLGGAAPFHFGIEADPKQSSQNIGQIYQGGLGLPDRDYYFKTDPKSDTLRQAYVAHLSRVFQLVGVPAAKADADAKAVMALETALAESSMTLVMQRDPNAIYHKMSVADLQKLAPSIDWVAYFSEIGVTALASPTATLDVSMPGFVQRVSREIDARPLDTWKAYLRAQHVRKAGPWLSKPFFDELFAFQASITGTRVPLPRWKQASIAVDGKMGEALGKAYVEIAFPPSSKQRMLELVNHLKVALRERIQSREWMSAATKTQALAKLDAIIEKIGYPDEWRDYSALEIDGKAPAHVNVRNADAFEAARQNRQVGQPVNRKEWLMSPPTVNAYYNPPVNEIVFPAGILQPPQFNPNADDAVNYGAIGMVIGHELSHGFDDQGSQYDAQGNLRDWWTPEDKAKFKERAQVIVEQYNAYVAVDTLRVNGELTLGENIGDLGGITIAYHAYQKSLNGKPAPVIDGLTGDQRFFLGFAQSWRRKLRPEIDRLRTLTDPHSPAWFRVNGPLSNLPEFAKTFGCKPGDPMVRDEKIRAEIW